MPATALGRVYQQRSMMVRRQLVAQTQSIFQNMPNWDTADALAVPAARISTQAQQVQARLLVAMSSIKTGDRVALDIDSVTGDAIRDGDITESWRVPMYQIYGALGDGKLAQDALVSFGQGLVQTQAITDLSYSQREAMSAIVSDKRNGFAGFWRVPNEGSSCEFCNEISTRLYFTDDLMPVHPGCECSVEPALPGDVGSADDG